MKMYKILSLFIMMFFIFNTIVFSQEEQREVKEKIKQQVLSKTNTVALNNLSREFKIKYNENRYEAIERLQKKGYLIKGPGIELQGFSNGRPFYYITRNRIAAQTTRTDIVWSVYNLDGTGIEVGLWDEGAVYVNHPAFREGSYGPIHALFIDSTGSEISEHATHVAGTIIADNDQYNAKGMADKSVLYSRDWKSDLVEMTNAAAGLDSYLSYPLILSNHSYGSSPGWYWGDLRKSGTDAWYWMASNNEYEDPYFGKYNEAAYNYDAIAYNAPYYTIVLAAGNDRGEGPELYTQHWVWNGDEWVSSTNVHPKDGGDDGFDCIPPEAVAKNIITVGAIDDIANGYLIPSDVHQTNCSFSVWGPADDGRIKPDIVANGDNLYSTLPDNTYGYKSGTSMAAPNVTGSLALLLQHYKNMHNNTFPRSSTLKAIIIHTADEAGVNPGPDYKYGWGLLNTYKAAQLISKDQSDPNTIQEILLQNGQSYTLNNLFSDGTQPLKITLCWNDIPPSSYQTGNILVKDLDVRLSKDGVTYYPWKLNQGNPSAAATTGDNTKDNVEEIFLQSPGTGYYTVVVTHKGTLNPSQMFSLIITGFTSPFVTFNLKQIGGDGQPFGESSYWENSTWNNVPPSQPVTLSIDRHHFLSIQDFKQGTYEKFNRWEDNLGTNTVWYRNWDTIGLKSNTNLIASRFIPKYSGITIKNNLEGTSVTGGILFFKDPWLTDVNELPYGLRNQGISAPLKQLNSPFYPDYTTSYNGDIYKGVFLNQIFTDPNKPYYSVQTLATQYINLGGSIGTRTCYFRNWNATGATLQDANATETAVVFTSSDAVVSANLKGQGLSNIQNAISNTSQRKFVRTPNGYLHLVYESIGKLWYEISSDNGATWQIANNSQPLGDDDGKLPSIENYSDYIVIVWQEKFDDSYRIRMSCFNSIGIKIINQTVDVDDQLDDYYTTNACPVICWEYNWHIMVVWKNELNHCLYYRYGICYLENNVANVVWLNTLRQQLSNTDVNSTNPTIASNKYSSNTTKFHLAWQQGTSSIQYCTMDPNTSDVIEIFDYYTPSAGSGYSKNYSPSMIVLSDNIPRLTWVAEASSSNKRAMLRGKTSQGIWNPQFFYFDSYVNSVSINSCSPSTNPNLPVGGYVFGWNRNSASPYTNKYIRNTNYNNQVSFGIAGKDLQVNNSDATAFNNFYGMTISTGSAPYTFIKSNAVSSLGKEAVTRLNTGRRIILGKNGMEFYFTVGSIKVDGQDINFCHTKESDISADNDLFEVSKLNEYLQTEPFILNTNSNFEFKVDYGATEPDKAKEVLNKDDKINIKLELIDDKDGKVIGKFKVADFNKDMISSLDATKLILNTSDVKSKIVRLRLKIDENLNPAYTICDYYANDESLPKENVIEMDYRGDLEIKDYGLSQNYPNPFNPTTIITYQLPQDSKVILKVYDVLGKEIITLVNEYKSAGSYSVEFNAGNLPSGIYFYELNANDFIASKKMLLVK